MRTQLRSLFFVLVVLLVAACSGGGGAPLGASSPAAPTSSTPLATPSTATVSVLLTDAPGPTWDQALATITSIMLIGDAGQQTIFSGNETVDLLKLADFSEVFTISDNIVPGTVSKIRLNVERLELVDLDSSGAVVRSVVAKLVGNGKIDLDPQGGFDVAAGDTLFVTIDFDMNKAFKTTVTGNGDVILRPVVRVNVTRKEAPAKLARLLGTISTIDDAAMTFVLCQNALVSAHRESDNEGDDAQGNDDQEDGQGGCVSVTTDGLTGLFGADGKPITFTDLNVGDELTAIGHLTQSDDASKSHHSDDDGSDEHGSLVLNAVTVEVGADWHRVAGTANSGVTGDVFNLAIDPGQNLGTELHVLPAQLYPKTRVFDQAGKELQRDAIVKDVAMLADGVLSGMPISGLNAALLVLDLSATNAEQVLHGQILAVDFDKGTLRFLVGTEEKCVDALGADIFFVTNNGGLTTVRRTLTDLAVHQKADVFGKETTADGCLIATDIIVDGASGNEAPVANAGADKTVVAGTSVMLDGSGSTDADGDSLTYHWTLKSKPTDSAATLTGNTTATPSFTTDKVGDYVVDLIVNDGTADSAPDSVTVHATATP